MLQQFTYMAESAELCRRGHFEGTVTVQVAFTLSAQQTHNGAAMLTL